MAVLFLLSSTAIAGDLNPPAGTPSPTMHTLDEIYYKINAIAGSSSVPKTGQTTCYNPSGILIPCTDPDGPGQDGDYQKGVKWPNPRFTDNNDGTVKDNLTGLIWLKDANRFGPKDWRQALSGCNSLADDGVNLTDGSVAGDWRLPNVKELQSLVDFAYYSPALSNTSGTGQWVEGDPFVNVQSFTYYYWTSTTYVSGPTNAGYVLMYNGSSDNYNKQYPHYVWPVRDGNSTSCP